MIGPTLKKNIKPKTVKQQALEYLKYWQKQLRLMDWNFDLEITDDAEEGFGKNSHRPNFQSSKITLLNPEKIPEHWTGIRDLEVTLVHEILHTRLIYAFGKKCGWHEEMAVETIAVALVANRRGISPEELE
jgi:hypothetical protein